MELGKVNGRGQNTNFLHEAVHPSHGLVWTDGKSIFLAPVQILDGQVEHKESLKLGEFEDESEFSDGSSVDEEDQSVRSIHWSSDVGPNMCYLCVVHLQHVSIWKVEGHVPKLSFKQVRKLNVQPIQQGCLWNPGRDILCVLSKQQCSFFFRHTQNRGSYAFPPIESGKITCGSWSEDGSQLVLCVGAMLLIYSWPEIDVSVSDLTPTAWRIPQLDGGVCSLVSLSDSTMVCAAELPLESLCKMQDTFIAPDIQQTEADLSPSSDIITPKVGGASSIKDTLLNLPRHPGSLIEDTSQLIIIHLRKNKEPQKACCVGVKGVLTPDILMYEKNQKCVVVGSNNQSLLQVYAVVEEKAFVKVQEIQLEKDQRPKGISGLHAAQLTSYHGVLIAIGKRTSSAIFPSSTTSSTGDIQLKFFPIAISEELSARCQASPSDVSCTSAEDFSITENMIPSNTSTPTSPSQRRTIKLQNSVENNETSSSLEVDKSQTSSLEPFNLLDNGISDTGAEKISPNSSVDLLLKKQKTISELRDYSDTDSSKSSPRDVDQDSSQLSPREITPTEPSEKVKIIDLDKSDSAESELETETVDFSDRKPNFKSPDLQKYYDESVDSSDTSCHLEPDKVMSAGPVHDMESTSNSSCKEICDSAYSSSFGEGAVSKTEMENVADQEAESKTNPSIEDLEREIKIQNTHIEELQRKVDSLSRIVEETSMVFPTRYQVMEKPDVVHVVCHCEGAKSNKKTFLLDNGRLPLEVLKDAFGLSVVELFIDGEPILVGSNIDGYMPVKFNPSSTIEITGILQPAADKDSTSEDMGIGGLDKDLSGVTC